jgi:hypothetical protein
VFRLKWQALSSFFLSLLLMLGTVGLIGCDRDRVEVTSVTHSVTNVASKAPWVTTHQLSEASPPKLIQELNKILDQYQPQVKILSPQPGETLASTTVEVKLSLQDLPTFQDPDLKLGPHLHLIVDNNPYIPIYDPSQPYTMTDLPPGTHTLRVFASRPWHESFKNEGAYAQVTFNVITPTGDNSPDPQLPVLTFSRPKGELGAEPIMLDYYLANAPLHWVAQENQEDEIADWRIRVTVNGESFVVDRWQPIYLKGFKEGDNWIQLEFLNENGDLVDNVFNNTVRLITYHPKGQDPLSKITRGELTFEQVRQIVDPTYTPPEKAEEAAPPMEREQDIPPEPLPQASPEEAVPPGVIPEKTNELPPVTEALPPEPEANESEVEPLQGDKPETRLEVLPSDLEPAEVEPVEIEPVEVESAEVEPESEPVEPFEPVVLEPGVESNPEVTSKSVLETPTRPDQLSVEPAIAKPESPTASVPEAIASPVDSANLREEKPLSPGIRYFDEETN